MHRAQAVLHVLDAETLVLDVFMHTGLGLDSCGLFCQDQLQLAYLAL